MRIIDKNTDFYDFYQDVYRDDTFTFDRRDAYILSKEMICGKISPVRRLWWNYKTKQYDYNRYKFVLLQICNNFWLFLIEVTDIDNFDMAKDYTIELLDSWRDFDKPRKLCNLNVVQFSVSFYKRDKQDVLNRVSDMKRDIHTNNYKDKGNFNSATIYNGDTKVEKHIPLLKACGIGNLLDAHEVYLAFEEYFSLEKSDSERREPLGTTDIDKVESHGFDKKISFRGK